MSGVAQDAGCGFAAAGKQQWTAAANAEIGRFSCPTGDSFAYMSEDTRSVVDPK